MARPARAVDIDEPSAASDRLAAMRLRAGAPGWVPEPIDAPFESPSDPVEPAPSAVAPSARAPSIEVLVRAWLGDRTPLWAHGLVDRVRIGSLLTGLAAVVVAIVLGVGFLHHHRSDGYDSGYSTAAAGPSDAADPVESAPTTTVDPTSIVVDVGGRVRKPGLVTLPEGARVADAIAAAGGPLRHKELATLDLAARVSDGQLLLVGEPAAVSAAGAPDASGGGSAAPVSLSSASIDELETLPGVGPVTAQKIIDWRSAHGGFTSVEQLQQVSGIGPARYAELSPLVTP